ncbi:MAG: two-component system, OmpR family, response regulator MprA [Ilumatobacteraceae bacterium]|jgi:DNA-binding response OmpR family regulator
MLSTMGTSTTANHSATGRVLVVDDDPKFVTIVVRFLERVGYEFVVAESGSQALRAVGEHSPDAIVLDLMMPGPGGIEVCQRLRAEGWAGGIVIVSARSNSADHMQAALAGADAFLAKPFPLSELASTIDDLVGVSHRPGSEGSEVAGTLQNEKRSPTGE